MSQGTGDSAPKPLTQVEFQAKIGAALLRLIDDIEQGVRSNDSAVTPKQQENHYLHLVKDDGSEHVLPARIDAVAYDDRGNTATKGNLTFRLWLWTGGEVVDAPLASLAQFAQKAGLAADGANAGADVDALLSGNLPLKAGQFQAATHCMGITDAQGDGVRFEQVLTIHPDDLPALKAEIQRGPASAQNRLSGNYRNGQLGR
jgi:hypothetical protein